MIFGKKHSFLKVSWAHCGHEDFIRPLGWPSFRIPGEFLIFHPV